MRKIQLFVFVLMAGMVIGQTFENPLPAKVYYEEHEFEKWYFYTLTDNTSPGITDTVKYILFRTRDVWQTFEKKFMTDHLIRPVYRVSRRSSPKYTYYHLPWGHSMISNEQYYIVDGKTGYEIRYQTFSDL